MCRFFHLARSSFYQAQQPTAAQQSEQALAEKIAVIQKQYFFTIGRRRMGTLLQRKYALTASETKLQRIMNKYQLGAKIRQVRQVKPGAKKGNHADLAHILQRDFQADKPFYRLVTDVTYVPYFEHHQWHWGYLSLVQDLYDRSIVAWVYARKQDLQLGQKTLFLLSLHPLAAGAILHSDRGSIYTAPAFRQQVRHLGLRQSFSRTGNCHDNATMECFNGTLKVEALYNPWATEQEKPSFLEQNARIERYIHFYNEERPCSVIGNRTPQEQRASYVPADSTSSPGAETVASARV